MKDKKTIKNIKDALFMAYDMPLFIRAISDPSDKDAAKVVRNIGGVKCTFENSSKEEKGGAK